MFEFFFKYPIPVFTKGKLILLGAWPGWVLILLIVVFAGGLAWLIWRQLPGAAPRVRNWRAWAVWGLEAATVALLLLLHAGGPADSDLVHFARFPQPEVDAASRNRMSISQVHHRDG